MTETLTQPTPPPRTDDDEPCGLTKGQIRGLCEPRLPWDFLKQNPSLYSMLIGAINAREQDLSTAAQGQEQLLLMCDALGVEHADIVYRATEALKVLRTQLKQLTESKALLSEFRASALLLKTVEKVIGSRGTAHAGISASSAELTALLDLGFMVVRHIRDTEHCLWCSVMRGHDARCPVGAYEALPKHGDVQTYKMKALWGSKRLSLAFQLTADTDVSVGHDNVLPAHKGDWVITPGDGAESIIMIDALFRSMFELADP